MTSVGGPSGAHSMGLKKRLGIAPKVGFGTPKATVKKTVVKIKNPLKKGK